jgi:hypothetical protein
VLVEHVLCVFRLIDNYSLLVLKLVTDIVAVDGSNVVNNLLPGCSHLICCNFLAIVKDMNA